MISLSSWTEYVLFLKTDVATYFQISWLFPYFSSPFKIPWLFPDLETNHFPGVSPDRGNPVAAVDVFDTCG